MSMIPLSSAPDLLQVAPLHRFSTADYLRIIEEGVLGPDDRVELIDGVIVEMSPAGVPHDGFLMLLLSIFGPLIGRHAISVQGTLTVAEGQVFDPDFLLLRMRAEGYKARLPDASDVLLLIEASDSAMRRDRQIKLPKYAAAGIREYWIADLNRGELIVCRDPQGDSYQSIEVYLGDQEVSPLAVPDFFVSVRQLFE